MRMSHLFMATLHIVKVQRHYSVRLVPSQPPPPRLHLQKVIVIPSWGPDNLRVESSRSVSDLSGEYYRNPALVHGIGGQRVSGLERRGICNPGHGKAQGQDWRLPL